MDLALRNAGKLKPELRLAQATSEFEAALNDEQKARMRSLKTGRVPSAAEIMQFSAELNQRVVGARHCFAIRFQRVLEFVQSFTNVLDTVIGGAQQPIASAAWGIVKLTLQIAAASTSYLEKLSMLFMDIGRSCPRYEEFGRLFVAHLPLQVALYEYFVCIVKLCQNMILFSNKSTLSRFSTSVLSPFEKEFGHFKSELDTLAGTIREEVSLAAKKAASTESKEASRFRDLSTISRHTLMIDLAKRSKLDFLDACSRYTFNRISYRQARKQGSTSWFVDDEQYNSWGSDHVSCALLCSGTLGSGKTVLSANIIDHISLSGAHTNVANFFCRFDDTESTKADTIIGTITRQLLENVDYLPTDPNAWTRPASSFDHDELVQILLNKLPQMQTYTIVIDGLDECKDNELENVLTCLAELLEDQRHAFKIFCTSRNDTTPKIQHKLHPDYTMKMAAQATEIENYVQSSLERCLEEEELSLRDPALIMSIRESLVNGANGMFLWVKLQIQTLCLMTSDEEIQRALQDLPRDLPQTYRRILCRVKESNAPRSVSVIKRIYGIVAGAKRPLQIRELRECLAVIPGNTAWNASSLSNNLHKTVASGGSILFVDEETDTVHFAHRSVIQYLTSIDINDAVHEFLIDLDKADRQLGAVCLTYLSLDVFERSLTRSSVNGNKHIQGLPDAILKSAIPEGPSRLALSLLRQKSRHVGVDVQKILEEMRSSMTAVQFVFVDYALQYWFLHTRNLYKDDDPAVWKLFQRICSGQLDLRARFLEHESLSLHEVVAKMGLARQSSFEPEVLQANHPTLLKCHLEVPSVRFPLTLGSVRYLRGLASQQDLNLFEAIVQSQGVTAIEKCELIYPVILAGCVPSFVAVWAMIEQLWHDTAQLMPHFLTIGWLYERASSDLAHYGPKIERGTSLKEKHFFQGARISSWEINEERYIRIWEEGDPLGNNDNGGFHLSMSVKLPLPFAIAAGKREIVKTLLEKGHLASRWYKCTESSFGNMNKLHVLMLREAIVLRKTDIALEILRTDDFPVDALDSNGRPPIFYAVGWSQYRVAWELYSRGAQTAYGDNGYIYVLDADYLQWLEHFIVYGKESSVNRRRAYWKKIPG